MTLTGSKAAGVRVAQTAGKYVKKGVPGARGSDAMVVLADADVEQTVRGAMMGRLLIADQVCDGNERIVIADALYEELATTLIAAEIGKPVPALGAFVQPTILNADNPVFYQEIFGPILSLFRAAD